MKKDVLTSAILREAYRRYTSIDREESCDLDIYGLEVNGMYVNIDCHIYAGGGRYEVDFFDLQLFDGYNEDNIIGKLFSPSELYDYLKQLSYYMVEMLECYKEL